MKNKVVCHITDVHSRFDGRIFQRDCQALAEVGYDVFLIVSDDKEDEEINGVKIISTGRKESSRFKRIIVSTRLVLEKALEIGADVYHLHDPELLIIADKLLRTGAKVVFDSHEFTYYQIMEKQYIPAAFRRIIAELYKKYESKIIKKIDAVVCPCTVNGKNYFDNVAKKTVFIDNLPISNTFQSKREMGRFSVCYVGALSSNRGFYEMLDVAEMSKTDFVVAGPADEEIAEKLKDASSNNKYFEYKGILNRNEVYDLMQSSNVGISIIHNAVQYGICDNLQTKIYEYMLNGLPVIVAKRTYTESFFNQHHVGILVDPLNKREIVDAILFLKNNPEEADKMGKEGRKVVEEKLCWDREKEKLFSLYEELLKSSINHRP